MRIGSMCSGKQRSEKTDVGVERDMWRGDALSMIRQDVQRDSVKMVGSLCEHPCVRFEGGEFEFRAGESADFG